MITLYDKLRMGHIKRWHLINTARQQTLAEHSFLVTVIALELSGHFGVDLLQTMGFSLFHDASESKLGDIPTPGKEILKRALHAGDIFEKVEQYLGQITPPTDIGRVIKMADVIEAAHFIEENGLGAHAREVSKKCWRAVEEYTEKFTRETGTDWYKPVNEILTALGMPYLNREKP